MKAGKKDLWLKRSANNLLILYLLMMVAVFIYASVNPSEFTYQEESLYSDDVYVVLQNGETIFPVESYSSDELNSIWWDYFFYYLLNSIGLLIVVWLIPEKREKIIKFEKKIMRMLR